MSSGPAQLDGLRIPKAAVPFILLQRPMLQRFQVRARQLRVPFRLGLTLEAWIRRRTVSRAFTQHMTAEYESLREFLPARATDVIDIGCGVAAIDALLFRHFGRSDAIRFFLVDRTEWRGAPGYGFAPRDEYYNSLAVARALLRANGIGEANVHTIEVGEASVLAFPAADLVISLASWGFHYPVSTYVEPVWRALRPGGVVILDVRAGTGEESWLERQFGRVERVCEVFNGRATRFRAFKGGGETGHSRTDPGQGGR